MEYRKIRSEMAGDVAIIRLDDPGVLNALDVPMVAELHDAVDRAGERARAVLLTGSGRAFCAGANLGNALGAPAADGLPDAGIMLEDHVNPLIVALARLPVPLVTAVRGAAAGVGCSLALIGDLIVASESAYFLQSFARIGLVPDGGSSWLLTKAIGRPRAMEMMLLAERIYARQALDWGLINRLTSEDALEQTALDLATTLAAGPTRSLGMVRAVAWAAADAGLEEALAIERRFQRDAGRTGGHREGVAAFFEKRAARFTGD